MGLADPGQWLCVLPTASSRPPLTSCMHSLLVFSFSYFLGARCGGGSWIRSTHAELCTKELRRQHRGRHARRVSEATSEGLVVENAVWKRQAVQADARGWEGLQSPYWGACRGFTEPPSLGLCS